MDLVARIKGKVSAIQKAMATAAAGVEEIRRAIADLRAERERVRCAPVPPGEAVAALDSMLARWRISGQEHAPGPDVIVRVAASGQTPQLIDPHAASPVVVLRLMMLLLGDQVREKLIAELETHYLGVEVGLPAAEREHRLREIDRELARLEALEEEAIQAAAEGGLQIDRRGDANPASVLGLVE